MFHFVRVDLLVRDLKMLIECQNKKNEKKIFCQARATSSFSTKFYLLN